MKIRTCAALLLAVGLPTAVFAVDLPEIEPNETKAQALTNGAFVLAAGDSVSGTTTGTSTLTAGAASADTFLVKTTPAALGIYRHRMVITTGGAAGHVGTIRGLASTSTGVTAGGDSTMQTSTSTTTPARMNQWYGFGKAEQLYYRVTGVTATTGTYTSTLSTDVVIPATFVTPPEAGLMTIQHDAATNTAYDRDMFLFDSNFNPIAGIDDSDTTALSVTLTPGVYYLGYGRFATAAGPTAGSSIIQGTFQTGTVLDFADIVASSSSSNGTQPVGLDIAHAGGTSSSVAGPALAPYDVAWFTFTVVPSITPTNPSATDTASSPVVRDGVATSTLTVTVTPGTNPTSTGLGVVVDASSVGGSSTLALADDGLGADATAGDNIFTGTTTVAYTTALGAATLPFTVTDDQTRSFNGSLNFTVGEASGACCTDAGCIVTTIGDCLDVQGGTFAGTGTVCGTPVALSADGAGSFEDISATGTGISTFTGTVDDGVAAVTLPFSFTFFGTDYTSGFVSTNGNFQFGTNNSNQWVNDNIPTAAVPNNALYPLWDDYDLDSGSAQIHTELLGTLGSDARFIIQWTNAGQYNGAATSILPSTFQIALFEDGSFEFRYQSVSPEGASAGTGDTTTIGYENAFGTIAYRSPETRDTIAAQAPYSLRGTSVPVDTGICGPSCPDCAADYDGNGGVDGGDLAAFFADFEAGETCADVDGNGGVDGGDLAFFFFVFEAGGCE